MAKDITYEIKLTPQGTEGMWMLVKNNKLKHKSERSKAAKIAKAMKAGAMEAVDAENPFNFRFTGGKITLSDELVKFLDELEERLHTSQEKFPAQYAESVEEMWDAIDEAKEAASKETKL